MDACFLQACGCELSSVNLPAAMIGLLLFQMSFVHHHCVIALVLMQACDGELASVKLSWKPEASLTVVMAAAGYPGSYKKGTAINNTEAVSTAKVFHAGTALDANGQLVASGGRVLGVTALGKDVAAAQEAAYEGVKAIDWSDAYFRKDIGWRAVARLKQAQHA
jgi:phosphoribosylamine--glycine ligase